MYTQEEYEAKRQARYERLLAAAQRAEREGDAARTESDRISSFIPLGQPILVGHHSEGRHRRALETIRNKARKGYELHKQAEEYRGRAASVEANDAIYSDNPQAVDLLGDKVAELEAEQAEVKRINAALRKGADFDTLEMSDHHRNELLSVEKYQSYYQPRTKGFPPYMLTSISTKIRTAKKRAEIVERKQSLEDTERRVGNIKIEYVPSENRIRIAYPARVPNETYTSLKQHGYRLAPSFGDYTFSAYYNSNAKYFADNVKE